VQFGVSGVPTQPIRVVRASLESIEGAISPSIEVFQQAGLFLKRTASSNKCGIGKPLLVYALAGLLDHAPETRRCAADPTVVSYDRQHEKTISRHTSASIVLVVLPADEHNPYRCVGHNTTPWCRRLASNLPAFQLVARLLSIDVLTMRSTFTQL